MSLLTKPDFDSIAQERAYYAAKADGFRHALETQVTTLKTNATASAKRSLLWGGAYVACVGVARALLGTQTHVVETTDGPTKLRQKESLLASAAKGAMLLGAGVVAARAARQYLAQRTDNAHAHPESLEPDTTEL